MDLSKKLAFLLFWTISSYGIGEKFWIDGILIKVNESKITLREFINAIEEVKKTNQDIDEEFIKENIKQNFIQELLLIERAKELGYEVTSHDLKKALEIIAEKNNFHDVEAFLKALNVEGISQEMIEEKLKKEILIEKVIASEVMQTFDITEIELKQHYENIKDNFKEKEKVHLKEIVLINPITLKEKEEKIKRQISLGKDFSEIAKEFSESPSREKGGDIGFIEMEGLSEEILNSIKNLKEGEVAGPIKTKYGVHFILIVEKKGESYLPFEEVKEKVMEDYKNKKYEEKIKKYLENLKSRYLIQINEDLLGVPK